jgi:hypothetical protein
MVLKNNKEDIRKRNFIEALRTTGDLEASMRIVGIKESTLMAWMEDDEDVCDQVIRIRKQAVLKLENLAFQQALEGDKSQIQFLLKAHNPEVYNKSVSETNITNVSLTKVEDNRVAGIPVNDAYDNMTNNAVRLIESMPNGQELIDVLKKKDDKDVSN